MENGEMVDAGRRWLGRWEFACRGQIAGSRATVVQGMRCAERTFGIPVNLRDDTPSVATGSGAQ